MARIKFLLKPILLNNIFNFKEYLIKKKPAAAVRFVDLERNMHVLIGQFLILAVDIYNFDFGFLWRMARSFSNSAISSGVNPNSENTWSVCSPGRGCGKDRFSVAAGVDSNLGAGAGSQFPMESRDGMRILLAAV